MKTDLSDFPDQPLLESTVSTTKFITSGIGYQDPILTTEDLGIIIREEKEIKIPNDRQLISIGSDSINIAMPKNIKKVLKKIDRIENPNIFDKIKRLFICKK